MRPSSRILGSLAIAGLISTSACSGGGSSTPAAPIGSLHIPSKAAPAASSGFAYDAGFKVTDPEGPEIIMPATTQELFSQIRRLSRR